MTVFDCERVRGELQIAVGSTVNEIEIRNFGLIMKRSFQKVTSIGEVSFCQEIGHGVGICPGPGQGIGTAGQAGRQGRR